MFFLLDLHVDNAEPGKADLLRMLRIFLGRPLVAEARDVFSHVNSANSGHGISCVLYIRY